MGSIGGSSCCNDAKGRENKHTHHCDTDEQANNERQKSATLLLLRRLLVACRFGLVAPLVGTLAAPLQLGQELFVVASLLDRPLSHAHFHEFKDAQLGWTCEGNWLGEPEETGLAHARAGELTLEHLHRLDKAIDTLNKSSVVQPAVCQPMVPAILES